MPQIWMTYAEITGLLNCDAADGRRHAIARDLPRRKSRDGLTRVKLDAQLMAMFIARIREADSELDQAIRNLVVIHNDMLNPADNRARPFAGNAN